MTEETPRPATSKKRRIPRWERAFLAVLEITGNVSEAARQAQTDRRHVYDHRNADPVFAAAWDDALDVAADALEAEARRRASQGVEEPVFGRVAKDRDGQIGAVRKYSDTLLIFLLKGARPNVYRERAAGAVNLNLTADELRDMSDADLDELARKRGLL